MKPTESVNPNVQVFNLEAQQRVHTAEANVVSKAQDSLAQVAQEFLDNPATKEEKRKARAEKAERLVEIAKQGELASPEELKSVLLELRREEKTLARNMGELDFSSLFINKKEEELTEKVFSSFMKNELNDKVVAEILNNLKILVPDNSLYEKMFILIENVNLYYVMQYQEVAEILAEIYSTFTSLNTAVSEMISSGIVDSEDNKITLDVAKLGVAIKELQTLFYSDSSPLVLRLKAIQFTPADLEKANELISGTGLILAGGPPAHPTYWLAISQDPYTNLMEAFTALAPTGYPIITAANVTTYQLQAFQVAFSSIGEGISNQMQSTAEKYRRTISQNDSFVKLLSSFMQANIETNKQFFQ